MKTLSTLKHLAFVSLCILASAVSSNAANIVWVSFHSADNMPTAAATTAMFTNAPDAGYTQLLRNAGHNVTRIVSTDNAALDTNVLNSADLVIISRSVPSGHYQDPPETGFWNTNVTAPVMILGGYILRQNRLGYMTGNDIPDVSSNPVRLTVVNPSHPIFAGVSLDSSNLMVNPYANIVTHTNFTQRGISVITNPPAGGATVLARVGTPGDAAFGGLVIGEWQAGATLADAAPPDRLAGRRLVFLTGSRENNGLTAEAAGIYDLTPEGARMFLNAVNYMAPPDAGYPATILAQSPIAYYRFNEPVVAPPPPDPATNSGGLAAAGNGLYVNCPTRPQPGAIVGSTDTSVTFDGQSQSVDVPFSPELNPAGAFTVEVWANLTGFTNFNRTAVASRWVAPGVQQGYQLQVRNTAGANNWRFTTYDGAAANNLELPGNQLWNVWTHVVAVYDGTEKRIYTNGVLAASAAAPYVANDNPASVFRIGGSLTENSGGDFWRGGLDEVAVYSVALTEAQILAHYQNGTNAARTTAYEQAVLADTPAGYWRLNEPPLPGGPPCPVAVNSGTRAAAANANYFGGAFQGSQAPQAPTFFGFETNNTAVQLNGSNAFVASVSGLLNGLPRFTISGWFRRETDQANRTGLWGQNDIVEVGYIDNNTIQTWTDNGLNVTPNPIPNGEWGHFTIVSEGSPGVIRAYTNGVFAAQRNHTLPATNLFRFSIGGGGVFDPSRNFFNGQIDEVAVFDRALTADQVASQYFSTVAAPPVISRQPQGVTNFEGATIRLEVGAAGTPPLSYQWFNFGIPVSGGTNAVLVITNASTLDSGSYTVTVTNLYGMVTSDPPVEVVIMPSTPPMITQEPASQIRFAGARATFTVTATGGSNLRFQWQSNSVNIANATNTTFTITNVQPVNAGNFRVIVSNASGSATSVVATLTVVTPAAGSYAAAVVAANPLAYWPLDETNGTTAFDFVGGFDGTYTGGVTLGVEGALANNTNNRAAQFDGTSGYVTTPLSLNNMPNLTLLGWMRRETDQMNRTGLWGQNDLVEFGYIDNNTIQAWVDDFPGTPAVNVTPNPIPNQEWGQLAVVLNSGILQVYTNGLLAGTNTLPSSNYGSNNFPFNIGGGGIFDTLAANGNWFNGRIDEVAAFGQALTPAQVLNLYNVGIGGGGGGEMRLSIARTNSVVTLSWTGGGTLQEAREITGPWRDSTNQANPQNLGTEHFLVHLTPGQEDPNPGTRSGVGNGVISLIGTNMLRINITFSGLSGTFAADHIHGPAGRGTNAGVLYDLGGLTTVSGTNGTITGTVTLAAGTGGFTLAQQLDQLRQGLWYVNIHTSPNFGGGEIRGQIDPVRFSVSMDPSQEPGTTGNTGQGQGLVALNGTALTVDLSFSGLSGNVNNAHYHGPAPRGTNTGVIYGVVPLTTMGGTSGTMRGSVTLTNGARGFTITEQLDQLNRGLWYLNIHTTTFGGGEIRGQVDRPDMQFFRVRQ